MYIHFSLSGLADVEVITADMDHSDHGAHPHLLMDMALVDHLSFHVHHGFRRCGKAGKARLKREKLVLAVRVLREVDLHHNGIASTSSVCGVSTAEMPRAQMRRRKRINLKTWIKAPNQKVEKKRTKEIRNKRHPAVETI